MKNKGRETGVQPTTWVGRGAHDQLAWWPPSGAPLCRQPVWSELAANQLEGGGVMGVFLVVDWRWIWEEIDGDDVGVQWR